MYIFFESVKFFGDVLCGYWFENFIGTLNREWSPFFNDASCAKGYHCVYDRTTKKGISEEIIVRIL